MSQEYSKFLADKKSLIRILFGQCDEATHTKIAFGENYTEDRDARRLLAFIEQMRTVCFGGDDGGLSYGPCKQVVAIKSLNTDRKMKISKSIQYLTSWIKILKSKSHVERKKIKDIG